jgi:hypothetical protein
MKSKKRGITMALPQSVYNVAFQNTKDHVMVMVQQLVPSWAQSMVNITDDEIKQISRPAAEAVIAAYLKATTKPTTTT